MFREEVNITKTKRLFGLLFSCLLVLGCLTVPVGAVTAPDSVAEGATITRATGRFEETIPANCILRVGDSFILGAGDVISYDCTYTPRNASIKFGYIGPDGLFYGLSGYNGSINKGIRVSERDSYSLAILNSSDEAVTVKGTVNY